MTFFEKCEDHYIKSHKKCEEGGLLKIVNKKMREITFEWPFSKQTRMLGWKCRLTSGITQLFTAVVF